MADIPSRNALHNLKDTEKATYHEGGTAHGGTSSPDSNEKSQKDIERTAPHGAGYELSHLPIDEHGEYVVTMKTWAVVVVSHVLLRISQDTSSSPQAGARRLVRSIVLASPIL